MSDRIPSPEALGSIRRRALVALQAQRHLAGFLRVSSDPYHPSPDCRAAIDGWRVAWFRLTETLEESAALQPLGWPEPTCSTLRKLVQICRGGWHVTGPDDFPGLEAEVEALGAEVAAVEVGLVIEDLRRRGFERLAAPQMKREWRIGRGRSLKHMARVAVETGRIYPDFETPVPGGKKRIQLWARRYT
jgi:hypothetical protein